MGLSLYIVLTFCSSQIYTICTNVAVKPDIDYPITSFAECEAIGKRIGAEFMQVHPKWRFLAANCSVGEFAKESDI